MIRGVISGGDGVVLAGRGAVDRALREAGASTAVSLGASNELDAEYLDSLASQARDLLGDAYEGLKKSFDHGRESQTPPKNEHRLMELLHLADAAATTFRAGEPAIDPVARHPAS
jgi:hypothetical protein